MNNLVFAIAAAGILLIILLVWIRRRKPPVQPCRDDIRWWNEL